jgi:hypothetical protein
VLHPSTPDGRPSAQGALPTLQPARRPPRPRLLGPEDLQSLLHRRRRGQRPHRRLATNAMDLLPARRGLTGGTPSPHKQPPPPQHSDAPRSSYRPRPARIHPEIVPGDRPTAAAISRYGTPAARPSRTAARCSSRPSASSARARARRPVAATSFRSAACPFAGSPDFGRRPPGARNAPGGAGDAPSGWFTDHRGSSGRMSPGRRTRCRRSTPHRPTSVRNPNSPA